MTELNNWINKINLLFTNTCDREELFAGTNKEVNKEDSISLYDLISAFNKMYVSFKREYDELDKKDLGKYVDFCNFRKTSDNNGNDIRMLSLYIENPSITNHSSTYLFITETEGKIQSVLSNDTIPSIYTNYIEYTDLDENKARKYLDLAEKHSLLLDLYARLSNCMLYGDGINILFTSCTCDHNNMLDSLNRIDLDLSSVDSCYSEESRNRLYASFNLGESFGIDPNCCYLVLNDQRVNTNNDAFNELLKRIYINKEYLVEYRYRYDEEKTSNQIKSLQKLA